MFNAHHRLALLEGQPSTIDPDVYAPDADPIVTTGRLWLVARETIEAGAPDAAVDYLRRQARPRPHPQAVRAAVDAAATGSESRWHDALAIAVEQGLRPIATDAFEGLAVAAARTEHWPDCLHLLAAAQRLRDQTGYVWRFGCEQRAVDHTRAIAVDALGDDDASAAATGSDVDWRAVAADVARDRARS
ncbi:MAG: hypothetical protein ACR2HQ_00215 [Ilumatobacteraceae bacterium]